MVRLKRRKMNVVMIRLADDTLDLFKRISANTKTPVATLIRDLVEDQHPALEFMADALEDLKIGKKEKAVQSASLLAMSIINKLSSQAVSLKDLKVDEKDEKAS